MINLNFLISILKGLNEVLCEICTSLKWFKPTKIQQETLPYALEGKDIIGLAETGIVI